MQKILILTAIILPVLANLNCSSGQLAHMKNLKKKYPYGLLGDDHGILTEEDLAINACIAEEQPFPPLSEAYPYWQCFPVRSTKIVCDISDYDSDLKSDMAILDFEIRNGRSNHDYLSRRAIELSDCKDFQADFRRLTEGQNYVCVSGGYRRSATNDKGVQTTYWVFDKFKTNLGCSGFFGLCEWEAQKKEGCKSKLDS
jgi:hypothetical protein